MRCFGGPSVFLRRSSPAQPSLHATCLQEHEGLFVTLLLAAFSTVVMLFAELLDPATGLQHHHLGDGDDHPEEIWVLEALRIQQPVISRAADSDTGSP